jgi:BlaI family penicillinase repressor
LTNLVYSYKLIMWFIVIDYRGGMGMENLKLCESDYRFMQVVWENEPVASGKLVTLCAEKLGWKKSTTYTVLRKMCEKGFLKNEDTIVTSVIPKEKVQAYESEYFVEKTFDGSLPKFIASFLGGKTLSEKEAEEIKRLIDAHKEG